jgi:protein phosphatase
VLKAWGASEKGPVRTSNQDRFAIDEARHLCVVADGVGGHNAGEVAARVAVDALLHAIRGRARLGRPFGVDPSLSESGNLIRTAVHLANMQVVEMAGRSTAFAGMGTTIVVALVEEGRVSVGHVGDSRLYRLSRGRLRQITGDDSWAAVMRPGTAGGAAASAEHHPLRHVLTNILGGRSRTEVHVVEEPLTPGDRLLLTTDGVHGALTSAQIERLAQSVPNGARAIVQAALANGSRDNCTAVLAEYAA